MAQSCSILYKFIITVFVLNLLVVCCSSSFAAEPPSVEPPSHAKLPGLCNYDEFFQYEEGIFDEIESCNVGLPLRCSVYKIYQLRDSISDVGNLICENNTTTPSATLIYVNSFPEDPTGRTSNDKLIIDYLGMVDARKAWCGSGGEHLFNLELSRMCQVDGGVSACTEADGYIRWDEMHLTQEIYRIISKFIMYHIFFNLH